MTDADWIHMRQAEGQRHRAHRPDWLSWCVVAYALAAACYVAWMLLTGETK